MKESQYRPKAKQLKALWLAGGREQSYGTYGIVRGPYGADAYNKNGRTLRRRMSSRLVLLGFGRDDPIEFEVVMFFLVVHKASPLFLRDVKLHLRMRPSAKELIRPGNVRGE